MFKELKIFTNDYINNICDLLYTNAPSNSLLICGGVSRCLMGENHEPKDLDIVTKDKAIFDHITENINIWFPELEITMSEARLIIYTPFVAIEIWNGEKIYSGPIQLYKGVLPFVLSSRMKKVKHVN